MVTESDIEKLKNTFATRVELKQYFDELMKAFTEIVNNVEINLQKEIREVGQTINSNKAETRTHRSILGEHEHRLQSLETHT